MIGRLANVLYWAGCGVAAVFALCVAMVAISPGSDAVLYGAVYAFCGVAAWLFGRACRYVLAGR